MAPTTKQYGEIQGPIVTVRRPKEGQDDDKTYITIKSLASGKFVSVTVWDNSHGEYVTEFDPEQGDIGYASGTVTKNQGADGKTYVNMSAYAILFFKTVKPAPRDSDDTGSSDDDDAPEVM